MNRELIERIEEIQGRVFIAANDQQHKSLQRMQVLLVDCKAALSQAEQISRGEIIDVLMATGGLSEGVTADAIIAAMRSGN